MEEGLKPVLDVVTGQRVLGGYGLLSKLAWWAMKCFGWHIVVANPMPDKCVIVMYPHTSNWDFLVGLLTKWAVGLDVQREALCFAGKESLFKWPWAGFFRAVGGFPVSRSASTGFVPQMANRFATERRMRFVIAPEGTRSYVPHVRSSFYFVAMAAKVPIVLGAFDFAGKRVVVNALFTPGGNVEADLAAIDLYYRTLGNKGAKPELAAPWKFRA